ncbi:hypothetical protein B0H17DRAFT_326861 [Mycena rosella]|uniref:Snurportin-1 n=1 Tax=Mycena rosella TaxID=1033263 RepID=A0AAD7DVG2_MYCRO|nr:hypothetical protein B0H17DRAFT_326861 [Mycena rosella]
MMSKNRKATYKAPPRAVTDASESQELRRRKALDEQKRRRAQRVDSARQLDLFADLNLGQSDDEQDTAEPGVVRMGVASYAALLPPAAPEAGPSDPRIQPASPEPPPAAERRKKKRKQKAKKQPAATSKWADQCMYAELLEMSEDDPWSMSGWGGDGLPEDLETGWVAVAPIPVGKRCLAVTDQSLGVPGHVSNTSLRSRKLGKLLMPRFPSTLPPSTILDCILDANWRENGILHILDVLKWKGQDIGDCETPFRFWWRDTRLGELPISPPPSTSYNPPLDTTESSAHPTTYRFPFPTKFLAIPYHTDTSLLALSSRIVPLARQSRSVDVDVPVLATDTAPGESSMMVDELHRNQTAPVLVTRTAEVCADGLLLYVAEASYEAGTSPLSSWIPIANYEEDRTSTVMADANTSTDGPLDVFHRLVQKRIVRNSTSSSEYNSSFVTNSSVQMDVES